MSVIIALSIPSAIFAQSDVRAEVSRGASIEIVNRSGDITVRGISGSSISARSSDRTPVINGDKKFIRIENARGASSDLFVDVPNGTNLIIQTTSGDIIVQGTNGDVDIVNSSGDISVSRSKRTDIRSISGDVSLSNTSGSTNISTTNGDITLRDTNGDITISSTSSSVYMSDVTSERVQVKIVSGDIYFTGSLPSTGRYDFNTHSGDVKFRLPKDSRAVVDIQTFNGDLVTDNLPTTLLPGRTPATPRENSSNNRNQRNNPRRDTSLSPSERFEQSVEMFVESILENIGKQMDNFRFSFEGNKTSDVRVRVQLGQSGGPTLSITSFSGDVELRAKEQ